MCYNIFNIKQRNKCRKMCIQPLFLQGEIPNIFPNTINFISLSMIRGKWDYEANLSQLWNLSEQLGYTEILTDSARGSEDRGFESHLPPQRRAAHAYRGSVYLSRDFSPRMRLHPERSQNISIGTFERSEVPFSLIYFIFLHFFAILAKSITNKGD